MIQPPTLPTTLEEWKEVHRKSLLSTASQAKSYESLILNILFGDEYLIATVDLLVDQLACHQWEIHEPIEKLLRAVSSPAVRHHLLDICFRSNDPNAISTACLLLPPLADPDLWPHLPEFASAIDPQLWKCGVAICDKIAGLHLMTSTEVKQAANLFRKLDDPYVANHVQRLDEIAATIYKQYEQ